MKKYLTGITLSLAVIFTLHTQTVVEIPDDKETTAMKIHMPAIHAPGARVQKL